MIGEELLAAQRARFAAADAFLPVPHSSAPAGEVLTAATADGTRVEAVLERKSYPAGSLDLLWSAQQVWQLFPYPGDTGTEGVDALLRRWRHRMDAESPHADSACAVTWPSRDAPAIRAFLAHGMVPVSVLAVRTGEPVPEPVRGTGVTVRLAGPEDFEETLELTTMTFDYTALVTSRGRANTTELVTPQLKRHLAAGAPIWLAESGGIATAVADCGWIDSSPGTWASELLPHGQWGYVNNVATRPEARGEGVGQTLMARVHREFERHGAVGTYLYYNPTNPLSSVFWPRQGYRPLWTFWEVQPASALR